ncbi:8492_t:CDS:10 [Diversispora eburnea]|uniref:Ribosome biogenesis protein NOP53 n=1 Tax=Diversispora eburnea TaxID=1213867 RepID=A0A9N8ZEU6_9GLOM|nr:8492_t:CDS:10 [Diversispora eburnea]
MPQIDSTVSTDSPVKKSTRPSRKGKKAWRKNVDITDIEETLDGIRAEERLLGGKIQDIPSEKLFFLDTKGDAQEKLSRKKNSSNDDNQLSLLLRSEKEKINEKYDIWTQKESEDSEINDDDFLQPVKKRKIKPPPTLSIKPGGNVPAVKIPHSGASYMPEAQAHQELLMIAHKEEKIKLQKIQRIKSQVPSLKVEIIEENIMMNDNENEISSDLEEEEEEENKDKNNNKEENKSKVNHKKTKTERNKEKKKLERSKMEEHKKQRKELKKNLERLPEIITTVEKEFNEREKMMIEREKLTKEAEKMPKNKIGKYRVRKLPTNVLLTDEIPPTFREFKPFLCNDSIRVVYKPDDELTKLRRLWWKEGNIHPQAKWEEAMMKTNLISVVYGNESIIKPSFMNYHETFIGLITKLLNLCWSPVDFTDARIRAAYACFRPAKPPFRVHDAIIIKIYPLPDDEVPTRTQFEFGTHDQYGNPKIIQQGQCVISIFLDCLDRDTFPDITIPQQLLLDPISLDFLLIRDEFLRMYRTS